MILVGGSFNINGLNFSGAAEVNFFIATSKGTMNAGPFIPTTKSPTLLRVKVPATTMLGQGFADVQVVNTDTGLASNNASALLQGDPAAGIPSITSINGVGLAATSSDPRFATNNVMTVVPQGTLVKLGGMGFDTANGVAVDVFCACPARGKVGPFFIKPGPMLTSNQVSFVLPATGTMAPATGPGSFVVYNKGTDGKYSKKSNAVSAPLGQRISVTFVTHPTSTSPITVSGKGFSTLTVINFFNTQSGGVVNLGGLTTTGKAKIPLILINSNKFIFRKPLAAQPGASYVQALNPPFVPFTSSGTGPGGDIILK